MYISRDIEKLLLDEAKSFQVITIYGSRQVGKTTTVDMLFGETFEFVTLDDAEELNLALSSPRAFFESHPWPLIIDEVQKAVGLLSEIKKIVDAQRRLWLKNNEPRKLMFILTGSNQFELQDGISESLAGRTAIINMSGFTQIEKRKERGALFDADFENLMTKLHNHHGYYRNRQQIFEDIFQGGMPDICTGVSERDYYYRAYIDTYIEKDVRKLISASSEMQFRRFAVLLALRTAQELVYSELANETGINTETCKRWISILQTSGIIYLLEPYMANASRRIIKAPKLYFMDTGLCTYLCRWPNANMLMDSAMSGAIFETYVVSEIIKSFYNSGTDPKQNVYYYRDIDKKEIDILFVKNGCLYPVEIKKGISPCKPTKNFKVLEKYKMPVKRGMVIANVEKITVLNDNAFLFPVSLLGF
jgi:hypothetical protein